MSRSPHIVVFIADQLRRDALGCYGNTVVDTPAIDSLAVRGTRFDNCYVTQPVCAPARASILTGLYPQHHGVTTNGLNLPPETPALAELVPDDYECGYFGKWHLGDDVVPQHGFDHWLSIEDWRRRYTRPEYRSLEPDYYPFLREHGVEPPPPESSYEQWLPTADLPAELTQASFLGDRASAFLRRYAERVDAAPLLLVVSYFEPHAPYTGPYDDMYDPRDIEVDPSFFRFPTGGALVNRLRSRYHLDGGNNPLGELSGDLHDTTTDEGWRRLRARYLGNVTLLDRSIGQILTTLERSSMADDTVVIFTSDHGEMAGDHALMGKRCMYEPSINVPLIVADPRHAPDTPTTLDGNVSHVDLVPMMLALAGEDTPSAVAELAGDRDVFVQWNGGPDRNLGTEQINRMTRLPWRTVVTPDRWKLNLSTDDHCELYDLSADPHELHNVFDETQHHDRVRDLIARLERWQHDHGDHVPLPSAGPNSATLE
jgi:arylsulfatase A-like enzyme